jgi:hypothetical protein
MVLVVFFDVLDVDIFIGNGTGLAALMTAFHSKRHWLE